MDNNNNDLVNAPVNETKKAYHTPVVKQYGSLTELTQFNPNTGPDGSTYSSDCTHS